jgi:hypothetical protein
MFFFFFLKEGKSFAEFLLEEENKQVKKGKKNIAQLETTERKMREKMNKKYEP